MYELEVVKNFIRDLFNANNTIDIQTLTFDLRLITGVDVKMFSNGNHVRLYLSSKLYTLYVGLVLVEKDLYNVYFVDLTDINDRNNCEYLDRDLHSSN